MEERKRFVGEQLALIPEHCRGGKKCNDYICYVVRSTRVPARTYAGSTNHFVHRLRQHNGLIKGGARATHTDRPWKICCLVSGFSSKSNALRYEYFTKVKHSRTYSITMAQGKDSIQRRAALLMTAELRMKPEERRRLRYFAPDAYMAECLRQARLEGVPGTMEAAWRPCKNLNQRQKQDAERIVIVNEEEEEEEFDMSGEEGEVRDGRVQEGKIALGEERSDSDESPAGRGNSPERG